MLSYGPSSDASLPSALPAPAGTEVVTRPEPGLARGAWEAPAWAFWVALAVVLLGAAFYVLRRTGKLSRAVAPPPNSKVHRS